MRVLKNIAIFLSLLLVLSCTAVAPNIKGLSEGDVNLLLKQLPKAEEHPNAGADLLYSYSYVEYFEDGSSVTRNIERILIFNERGRNFSTKSISYREGYQDVKILFANTIKPDGKIIPLDVNDIHDSSEYAGYEFYTDIKVKKFTMPAVENGCILELAYEIRNLTPVLSYDYSDTFFCQNSFPMEEDVIEIVLPEKIELNYKKYNTSVTPQIITDGNKKRYIFVNKKQNEIVPEARMPSIMDKNIFPQISFWTLKNWSEISVWYAKLFQEQMKPNDELTDFTKKLVANAKTDEEKIDAIFNFVSQNIRYIAVLLGPHTHKPHLAYEIFQKRYGDCKDKTVLLLTMLKIAGIKGLPALVPANGKYFDDSIPSISAFNHVIAAVPYQDKFLWLDATNETAAYDSPPFTLPTKVFLIREDGSHEFVTTPPLNNKRDYYVSDIKYDINKDGNADVDYSCEFFGKAAESIRYSFKYASPEKRKKFFENRGIEVRELHLGSFSDTKIPFAIKLTGNIKNLAQVLDEETMVLSNVVSLDSYRDVTSAGGFRRYPISLTQSILSREISSFKFPAGFKIKRLPADFIIKKPFLYRKENFSFKGSVFKVFLESKNEEQTIGLNGIYDFRKNALELQKHETSVKNFIFEKK